MNTSRGVTRRMVLRSGGALSAAGIAATGRWTSPTPAGASPLLQADAEPTRYDDPIGALLLAFGQHQIVALGEAHRLAEQHDFLQALLRHPDLPLTVNDIVVEFGNAGLQSTIDVYLSGGEVDPAELRRVWRDTTQSPMQPWDSPVYEAFFATVREVNADLPPERQIRVHLGDPPVDWAEIGSRDDLMPLLLNRDAFLAYTVESKVLAQRRPALVIAGALHLLHGTESEPPDGSNAVAILDGAHPGSTFVVVPHIGFGPRTCELEGRLASWPKPSLATIAGSWLGEIDPGLVLPVAMIGPDGEPVDLFAGRTLGELVDGYLYLGPLAELSAALQSRFLPRDDADVEELTRRATLIGAPFDVTAPEYVRYGVPARAMGPPRERA